MARTVLLALAIFPLAICRQPEKPGDAVKSFPALGSLEIDLPARAVPRHGERDSLFDLDAAERRPRILILRRLQGSAEPSDYRLREVGAGSGGTEYELQATLRRCGQVIDVRCLHQQESGPPDMSWCTRALDTLRCRQR